MSRTLATNRTAIIGMGLGLALLASGCVANQNAAPTSTTGATGTGNAPISVTIKDDACTVATNTVPSGTTRFTLKNEGTARNEFEILAEDKLRIVGERENLGPGTTTDYTVVLKPGTYYTACKKNMVGALVDINRFTVTDSGQAVETSENQKQAQAQAEANYLAYVRDQTGQLLEETKKFAKLYQDGQIEAAKAAYATTRMYYERIEPTAEAFGDIDPALDEREADWQESEDHSTREWSGWHVIEKDLWEPNTTQFNAQKRKYYAEKLVADTQKLYDLVYAKDFSISLDDISNGAIGLLEEVAVSKISGEEEAFSHTDLWDFKANVEGAKVAYGNVRDFAAQNNAELVSTIDKRFTELEAALAKHAKGDGYQSYDQLSDNETKALADRVNALRKPLSQLTEAVLK